MLERSDWNACYIDKSRWILDHLENLNLSASQALMLLVINFLNETRQSITPETLAQKCAMEIDAVYEDMDTLCDMGYLSIDTHGRRLMFSLDGLLDTSFSLLDNPLAQSLFHAFSTEFGKPLSPAEMDQIAELAEHYEESMILHALDEAAVYDKRSVPYVTAVLSSWKDRGLSALDIEEGRR